MTASQPLTALVVEDDETIALLLQLALEREKYTVHLLRDGRAGQAYIESRPPPSFALLDVMLPFVDGFQLVRLMRAQPGWREVPILMLTGKTHERDIVRALDAGASDYIAKPFQLEELLARVRRFARHSA